MPPLNVCYVQASTEDDLYAAMACISATFVRRLYPDAHIHLVCDEVTAPALRDRRAKVLDLASEVTVVDTGMPGLIKRSRFVKTSLRQVVRGDFIFLDVDT